ncbi:MAG: Gfo/Idh/MocA family oxidoreductase [Desulfobacteraceae bacterium]
MNKDVGIAVIGSGYWGKNLVRNYYEMGNLKLICDKNEAVLAGFQGQYPGVEGCLALHEVLGRKDIDGVVVATPAETHYRLAREALLAGKHVYVEKPLVLDEAEGEELISLAGEKGVTLMVGHLLQYHPVFECLKNLAKNGELGRINYIYSHRLNLGKIRREENILWSFAPHDISMILALAGEAPEAIQATGGNYLHKRIADVTTTHLEFPSGLQAHIFVSWLHPFKEQKLVVVGDKRMAVFDDTLSWEDKLLLYLHEIQWQQNIPVPSKADPERVEISRAEPLRQECAHFLHCISNGCRPVTDGAEGLRVLRVLNEAQRSLDGDGQKIDLAQRRPDPDKGKIEDERVRGLEDQKENRGYFVHETAVVDEGCEIGEGCRIWHFSHVLRNSRIGEGCNVGQNVMIGPDVVIGHRCKIQNNVSVYKGVTLEDGVFCGPSMVFTNIYNPRAEIGKMDQVRPTLVKHGATLGANCTILCGTSIGEYGFVGAGAVVTRNVPDHALMLGNPARRVGWMCQCGERLPDDLECLTCGKVYTETEEGLKENIRQDQQD